MSAKSRQSTRLVRVGVVAAAAVALVVAMVLQTKFLTPAEVAELNPPAFSLKAYVEETYPKVVEEITAKAVDITTLGPAVTADLAAAGKEYGVSIGSGKFAFAVTATGAVKTVDENFILLAVAGLPADLAVRIPLGAAISGTPIRDAPGTIKFSDFLGQTDYQSVANEFKLKTQTEVISTLDPASLSGKTLTVIGAYASGGPPGSFIIQPVSVEVGA